MFERNDDLESFRMKIRVGRKYYAGKNILVSKSVFFLSKIVPLKKQDIKCFLSVLYVMCLNWAILHIQILISKIEIMQFNKNKFSMYYI